MIGEVPNLNVASEFFWYHGPTTEPENYIGPHATRDQAIAAGRADFDDGVFSIIEARTGEIMPPTGDEVIDLIIDANDEAWPDGFEGLEVSPEVAKAAEDELTALLAAWFEKHRAIFPAAVRFDAWRNHEVFNAPAAGAENAQVASEAK